MAKIITLLKMQLFNRKNKKKKAKKGTFGIGVLLWKKKRGEKKELQKKRLLSKTRQLKMVKHGVMATEKKYQPCIGKVKELKMRSSCKRRLVKEKKRVKPRS